MAPEIPELPHPARKDMRLTDVLFALSDPERLAIVRVDGLHGQWQQAPAHAGHL